MLWDKARLLLMAGERLAVMRITGVKGSAPREEGAVMILTRQGTLGSIGGGTLEWQALAKAQKLLTGTGTRHVASYALGPDLGQCCGGRVEVLTEIFDRDRLAAFDAMATPPQRRMLYLFGAGHVGKALMLVLAQTDFAVQWIDPRPGAFPAAVPGNMALQASDDPQAVLAEAPAGSIVLVMSHSHALDLAIVDAALRHPAIAATGLIGSATKRARFEKRLREAGVPEDRIKNLICPIGIGEIRAKTPQAIAISTAAQLLALDERLKAREGQGPMQQPRTASS